MAKLQTIATTKASLIPRHGRDGRPKIFPPEGGKGDWYTRTTTFIDCLDDKSQLTDWKLRTLLDGLQIIGLPEEPLDRQGAAKYVDLALKAGGIEDKAAIGTALHEFTEAIDLGKNPGNVPWDLESTVKAYARAVEELDLRFVAVELFGVEDRYKVAGTLDRLIDMDGEVYLGDVKTSGSLSYSIGKFTMQLALYQMMKRYNPRTYERTTLTLDGRPINDKVGYIIWIPQGVGRCEVVPVDLEAGRRDIELAYQVRDYRKRWNRKAAIQPPIYVVEV